jgi:hypothetical protein
MLFDETGVLKWAMQPDFFIQDQNPKAVFLADNSIIFAGTPANTPLMRPVICRISEKGTLLWTKHIDYTVSYTGGTSFKDLIPDPGGGFIICTSNYFGGTYVKAGLIHLNADGEVIKSINLGTVTGNDLFIGSLTGNSTNMMLAARMAHSVCTVKLRDLSELEWQSSPVSIGFSIKDFTITNSALNNQSFLSGTYEKTDLGFEDLCVLRMDSMMLGNAAIISVPDHTLDSWNGGIVVVDETLFIPGTIREAGNSDYEMTLTAMTNNFKSCGQYSDYILTGVFSTLTVSPYPVSTRPDYDNRSPVWMLLLQDDVRIDTAEVCSKEYFACRSRLDAGPDLILCKNTPVLLQAPVYAGYQYRWSTSDTTAAITVAQTGTYILQLIPPSGFGCDTLYDTVHVTFVVPPEPEIIASAYTIWPGELVSFTMRYTLFDSVKWEREGVIKSVYHFYEEEFNQNGVYRVKLHAWTSQCEVTDSVEIIVNGNSLFVPDVFSPNSDRINEWFGPRGKGIVYYKLIIYNRWGEMVHTSENEGWSGRGAMPGTYVYQLEVRTDKGATIYRDGKVELVR